MKKSLIAFIALLALSACSASPTATKASSGQSIEDSERLGQLLFQAINSEGKQSPYTNREKDLIDMSPDLRCEGHYAAVSIVDEKKRYENLYLILTSTRSQGVQFGRHIRFRFKLGTNELVDVTRSTKSCLLVPVGDGGAPFATHLLSEEPTEFHVFLSLFNNTQLYVSTSSGLWSVANGKITKLKD